MPGAGSRVAQGRFLCGRKGYVAPRPSAAGGGPGGRRWHEPWRHLSVVEPVADRTVAGLGGDGYRIAVEVVADLLDRP